MKSERAKRVLIRSKTTQTTEPHRKFFVLILERAGGQNVRHLLVNVTAKLSFTFLTSEYYRSPKYIMGKIEKTRLMADSPISKNMTPPLGYTSSDNLSLEVVRILVSPPPIAPSFTTNEQPLCYIRRNLTFTLYNIHLCRAGSVFPGAPGLSISNPGTLA